ncbi:hypothetical protein ACP70R_032764 [Stipagrostis hirtigluma subsp. patula]
MRIDKIENRLIVNMRGKSPKELDRESLMDAIRVDRKKRQYTAACLVIQNRFRIRNAEFMCISKHFQEIIEMSSQQIFRLSANHLSRLISLFNVANERHISILLSICILLRKEQMDLYCIDEEKEILKFVLKRLALLCLRVSQREQRREFLETTLFLGQTDPSTRLYLQKSGAFGILRAIIQEGKADSCTIASVMKLMLESIPKTFVKSFICEILTLPCICKRFEVLKKVLAGDNSFGEHVTGTMCSLLLQPAALPFDRSNRYKPVECLFGNLMDITSTLMPKLPPDKIADLVRAAAPMMTCLEDSKEISADIKIQVTEALNPKALEIMVKVILEERYVMCDDVVECLFDLLYKRFRILIDFDVFYTRLTFETNIIHILWRFITKCSDDPKAGLVSTSILSSFKGHRICCIKAKEFVNYFSTEESRVVIRFLKKTLWAVLSDGVGALGLSSELIAHIQREVHGLLNELRDWFLRTSDSTSVFYCEGTGCDDFVSKVKDEGSVSQNILRSAPLLVQLSSKLKLFKVTIYVASALLRENSKDTERTHEMLTSIEYHVQNFTSWNPWPKKYKFEIRRSAMVRDSLHLLGLLPKGGVRGKITVVFYDEHGVMERGLDGGGLLKEMITEVFNLVCNGDSELFEKTEKQYQFFPNRNATSLEKLKYFRSLGRLFGKAISEGVPLDLQFAPFFCKKLKQKVNSFSDMLLFDEEIYNCLCVIKDSDEDYISQMKLDFEGLIPGGENKIVTKNNVIEYAHMQAHHQLNVMIEKQTRYFLLGLHEIILPEWLGMFDEDELQILISGNSEVNVDDLKDNTIYDGFNEDNLTVRMFWEVLRELSNDDRKRFLRFVTSCPRTPAGGFQYMEPKFKILKSSDDVERLPTASTCNNTLMIPPYDRPVAEKAEDRDGFWSQFWSVLIVHEDSDAEEMVLSFNEPAIKVMS